jgi:transcription-repair coupling factor (superfamily II helicase)
MIDKAWLKPGRHTLSGVPEGLDSIAIAEAAEKAGARPVLHIARSAERAQAFAEALTFFAPDLAQLSFPAWDCLPYDRVSPVAPIMAERLATLAHLLAPTTKPLVIVTTVSAVLQRIPARTAIAASVFSAKPGQRINSDELQSFLANNGYQRTGTVVDPGDFAVRGGLIDIYPPGSEKPIRLDFFGDTLETIRAFDPQSQRSTGTLTSLQLNAANEVLINAEAVARFRTGYAQAFGGIDTADPLYESVTGGRRYQGVEHWLPLFHERLETIFDYVGDAVVSLDHEADEAAAARQEQIAEFHDARRAALDKQSLGAAPYKPLPPTALYLSSDEWKAAIADRTVLALTPFEVPGAHSFGGRRGKNFAAERAEAGSNVYEAVRAHLNSLRGAGKRAVIATWTQGSTERLATILEDHDVSPLAIAENWRSVRARSKDTVNIVVLGLEEGFETADFAVIAEQDILGDRLIRRGRQGRKADDIIHEISALSPGDLVVHVDHGIGRFEGLKTIEVQGAPHDCLHLVYAGNDRLFLPVENIELISRYGSGEEGVQLDRLGGGGWQARKARLKERIREIAHQLIATAAQRELKPGDVLPPPEGAYDEFSARFPYAETDDQLTAIAATIDDLQKGRPMDRLVCGDVGFGKTEVALRAAFITAMNGKQVAIVVPTTLLARQHYATFGERFRGMPLKLAHLSRLVGRREIDEAKKGLTSGDTDIAIGTHALLASDVKFRDLGLLVIDEEQHFGVKHKERLKELKAGVHVLTLTATPIPRTLQLALSGVREMSLIATPPVDRLAIRTYISPFDPVIIRETLLREHYRGGQSFYVCPRISDLAEIAEFLRDSVPEVKFRIAHGQMPPGELDDIMTGFYDRAFDVLLSTTIVESGLDIPTANTLVLHRADMFGLAQLYQLRGRVGRAKQRAYALLTTPANRRLTATAEKRLKILQSLDSLGVGFSLASHDLDLRGAGNLLGDEQSGHIKEVGYELYQQMLEEAVANLRAGDFERLEEEQWSPQINIGTSVLIPETFVADLQTRLGLYRRLSAFSEQKDLDAFAAELHDRFGRAPEEVAHLLDIVSIKLQCRRANVASVEAGPKGAVIGFRNGVFANPPALVQWISGQGALAKLRPDMKLVIMRSWASPEERLKGARGLMTQLEKLAA